MQMYYNYKFRNFTATFRQSEGLIFVPIGRFSGKPLIPEESPGLHYNQLFFFKFNYRMKYIVIKRSGSNMSFLCESEAAATCLFCAKAKRQQQTLISAKHRGRK